MRHLDCLFSRWLIAGCFLLSLTFRAQADIALETETGDLGKKGEANFSQGIQFDKYPGGRTTFLLTQFEYAMTDNSEILIEPFFYQWTRDSGSHFQGLGDLEITPSYRFVKESARFPAILAAFKVKVPMASNPNIGTRRFDWYPYFIINKHFGAWDINVNLGAEFFGQTGSEYLRTQLIYDLSIQHPITKRLEGIVEIFGNTKPNSSEQATFAGAVALEFEIKKHFNIFLSVGYDTDKTLSVRPGFNIPF